MGGSSRRQRPSRRRARRPAPSSTGFPGSRCLRGIRPTDTGRDRAPHRPAPIVGPPPPRAPGSPALAPARRPRLRVGYATRRIGVTGAASGPYPPCRDSLVARSASGHRTRGPPGGPRRIRRRVPGEDRRSDGGGHPNTHRGTAARTLYGRAASAILADNSSVEVNLASRDDTVLDQHGTAVEAELARSARTVSHSSGRNRSPDSVVWQHRSVR